MDITKPVGVDETETDRDVHSKGEEKALSPTKELYGEINALLEWLNRSFYRGELPLPMVTFRNGQKCFGVYVVPEKWDHVTGARRREFRLSPLMLRQASFETQCMELLQLMEHLRQGKPTRTNYHDRDYAEGMKALGLRTHRQGRPDKETGELITLSVIPGGKFEKLVARKSESFAFSWAIREAVASGGGEDSGDADTAKTESKSGRKFKYQCPVEGCSTAFWGKDGQKGGCFEHDPPVRLAQVD